MKNPVIQCKPNVCAFGWDTQQLSNPPIYKQKYYLYDVLNLTKDAKVFEKKKKVLILYLLSHSLQQSSRAVNRQQFFAPVA